MRRASTRSSPTVVLRRRSSPVRHTVNVVAPGPIQTGYITPEDEAVIARGTPLGRMGTPQDVADVIVFLASEQARWLTGQLLYVGGGWKMPQ